MPKTKIVAAGVISLVGLVALTKMFVTAATDQGGSTREFADKSRQQLEQYKEALAESRPSSSDDKEMEELKSKIDMVEARRKDADDQAQIESNRTQTCITLAEIRSELPNACKERLIKLNPKLSAQLSTQSNTQLPASFKLPSASCGDKPTGNTNTWYPVFIDGANLGQVREKYCGDAIATTRKDTGVSTVQLASFDSRDKALAFAKQVGGDVGELTTPQSMSAQPSPGTPDSSQLTQQEEQSTLEAQIKKQKAEQKIIEATNLCQEKYLKFQKQSNELRKSTASYAQNPMTDFADSIAESHDQLAKAELQSCLTKAQLQGKIRAGE